LQRTARCERPKQTRPRLEVADILRTYGEAYRQRYVLTPEQHKVFHLLQACRTELLGGHVDVCDNCGLSIPSYNSCRNRHCPKCQSLAQERWVHGRMERILPVPYFHVVFTVPSELRPIARRNNASFYALMFRAASRTLLELCQDPKRLGAKPGITSVLHTWTRDLRYHPHVHCVVTGGGLAPGGDRWIEPRYRSRYLLPQLVLAKLFRGKLLASLDRAARLGDLDLGEDADSFPLLKDALYRKRWGAYAKRPFAGPKQVFRYLGFYTHRVGISNHRLLAHEDGRVTFATKNGATATVPGVEFVRRFLHHVLPARFVKIRHYGLHAPANVNTRLETARQLLEADEPAEIPDAWEDLLEHLVGDDPRTCPKCKVGTLIRFRIDNATGGLIPLPRPDT